MTRKRSRSASPMIHPHAIKDKTDDCLNAVRETIREHGFLSFGHFLSELFRSDHSDTKAALSHLFNASQRPESYFEVILKNAERGFVQAKAILDAHVKARAPDLVAQEIACLYKEPGLRCPEGDELTQASQLDFSFEATADLVVKTAPFFCDIVRVANPPVDAMRKLSPEKFEERRDDCVVMVLQNMFLRCNRINRLQTIIGIFLMSNGAQKDSFTFFNQLGLSVSYQTCLRRLEELSISSIKEMQEVLLQLLQVAMTIADFFFMKVFQNGTGAFIVDNINQALKTYEQRLENPSTYASRTSWTLIDHPEEPNPPLKDNAACTIDLDGIAAQTPPIATTFLFKTDEHRQAFQPYFEAEVKRNFASAEVIGQGDATTYWPEDVQTLPLGPTRVMPGPTLDFDESKTSDMIEIMCTMCKEGGVKACDVHGKVLAINGDQLTVARIKSAKAIRAASEMPTEDEESAAEDYAMQLRGFEGVPGLFHLLMKIVSCVMTEFWGTQGLSGSMANICTTLGRLRINPDAKEYYACLDLINHAVEGHLIGHLCKELGRSEINSPNNRLTFPNEAALAKKVRELAATIDGSDSRTQFLQDGIMLRAFIHVIRRGDIGRLPSFLKWYAVRMAGYPKSQNYQQLLLEFVHKIEHIYKPGYRYYVFRNMLVNPSGKANGFMPADELQEHLIRAEKKFMAMGTGAQKDYNRRCVSCLKVFLYDFHRTMMTLVCRKRSEHHTSPSRKKDVELLATRSIGLNHKDGVTPIVPSYTTFKTSLRAFASTACKAFKKKWIDAFPPREDVPNVSTDEEEAVPEPGDGIEGMYADPENEFEGFADQE